MRMNEDVRIVCFLVKGTNDTRDTHFTVALFWLELPCLVGFVFQVCFKEDPIFHEELQNYDCNALLHDICPNY